MGATAKAKLTWLLALLMITSSGALYGLNWGTKHDHKVGSQCVFVCILAVGRDTGIYISIEIGDAKGIGAQNMTTRYAVSACLCICIIVGLGRDTVIYAFL